MQIPKSMREQMRIYEREGFVLERLEQVNASHFRAYFKGVPQIQFLTAHTGDWRGVRNNISRMRRSMNEEVQGEVVEQKRSAPRTVSDTVRHSGGVHSRNV